MKYILQVLFFCFLGLTLKSQQNVDSLKSVLAKTSEDSMKYRVVRAIYDFYEESNRDSAFYYANQSLELSRKNNKKLNEVYSLDNMAYQLIGLGRYAESLKGLLEAFQIAGDKNNDDNQAWPIFTSNNFNGNYRLLMVAYTHHIFGILLWQTDDNEQSLIQFAEARRISSEIGHNIRQMMADMNLGRGYWFANKLDTALQMEKEAEQLAFETGFKKYLGQVYSIIGGIFAKQADTTKQLQYYHLSAQVSKEQNNLNGLSSTYFSITRYFLDHGEKDSALYYAMKNLEVIRQLGPVTGLVVNIGTVYENIYMCYKLGGPHDSLFKYQSLTLTTKDSLYKLRIKSLTDFQNVTLKEQLRLQNLEKEKVVYQNKVRTYFLLGGIGVLLLLAIIFYRNNRQKHKANIKIEKAYDDLKSTQQQLIQSEKMASLGELTAGIAHEIQNPLNFVNNFSEVNKELLAEMNEELGKGNYGEVKTIAKDVSDNEEKINFHGKRADTIVKGMLQHSRSSNGIKEPTDINALADEYLRLAYHGLRAKDKSFNATMKTHFDESIGKINIIPQDIGRVILNLITNAFYVVDEKKKQQPPGFEPVVSVSTKKLGDKIELRVKDNGNGIPAKVLDKIFQPFFTTKPTGQGTGLGLSLSYDIVKAHGGQLKVETKEARPDDPVGRGEGSEFIIQLPIV